MSPKIFYLFLITLSNAKGFPSEPEENDDIYDLLSPDNSTLDIKSEHEDSVNVDKIQEELKEQKTVFNKIMSNIHAEMTKMKKCLLRHKSISVCTAALEKSNQEALDWATPQKEDHRGISDPGESESEPVDMKEVGPPRTLSVSATGEARREWSSAWGDFTLTEKLHRDRPVYKHSKFSWYLYSLESGAWGVSLFVGDSQPVIRSTTPVPSPALCQNWEYWDDRKYNPGDISVVDISDPGESQEGHFIMTALLCLHQSC